MSTVLTAEPVHLGSLALPGDLVVPAPALGLVVLAQGCSRDRLSTRNQWVARAVQRTRMATLLFDLLTDEEACDRHRAVDVDLLAQRVLEAIQWTEHHPELAHLRLGLFGTSTGAAAALVAAAARPDRLPYGFEARFRRGDGGPPGPGQPTPGPSRRRWKAQGWLVSQAQNPRRPESSLRR